MSPRSGATWMFAVVYSSIGFAIYIALGLVADRALGLAPVAFLAAGLLFGVTMLTYLEGSTMYRERGGSSMFARHAFNELASFVAGWAVLIDYLVILALASLAAASYLGPIPGLGDGIAAELGVAAVIVIAVSHLNLRGVTGRGRVGLLALLAVADIALQVLVVAVGAIVLWQPDLVTAPIELGANPGFGDLVSATVIALIAYAGIESAADLAPDVEVDRRYLGRIVWPGAVLLPVVYAATAFVALLAVPVVVTSEGPATGLGSVHVGAPFLGIVAAFDPSWLATAMRWLVMAVVLPTLVWAASLTMLGLSRHIYALAVNRQIPSWLGKLDRRHQTPRVAIIASAAVVLVMLIPRDHHLLAEIYAVGATVAIATAHLSIIRLRRSEPERRRPFRVPWSVGKWAPGGLPVPSVIGAVLAIAALVSVLVLHEAARWIGGAWMVLGIVGYVFYRRVVEGTSLTERLFVPAEDLSRAVPQASYRTILVPVLGTDLDEDIVGTAGRLAAAVHEDEPTAHSRLSLVCVIEVPLTRDLEAPLADEDVERANAALERARQVALEYADLDVTARVIRARSVGAGIVAATSEEPVEAIVIGGEPPSKVRGGAAYGGIGGQRPPEIGPVTEHVLKNSPARVLLTAPPAAGAEGPDRPEAT